MTSIHDTDRILILPTASLLKGSHTSYVGSHPPIHSNFQPFAYHLLMLDLVGYLPSSFCNRATSSPLQQPSDMSNRPSLGPNTDDEVDSNSEAGTGEAIKPAFTLCANLLFQGLPCVLKCGCECDIQYILTRKMEKMRTE